MLLLGVTALAQVDPDAVNSTASRSVATLTVAGGLPEDAAALLQLAEVRCCLELQAPQRYASQAKPCSSDVAL